jgi:non-canonical purine NTP pyrophosphatase (RdgB/HAM1 family)
MDLERLVFVTSNEGKLREAEAVLRMPLENHDLDLVEPQSLDIHHIVRSKAITALEELGVPVLVEDTGLELLGLGGFPGPLIRWLLASVGPAGICTIADAFADRRAVVRCVACAASDSGVVVGEGVVSGAIAAQPRGLRGFGWDSVFVPDDGDGRTYGEMEEDEKNAISHRRKAFLALRNALRRNSPRRR